MRIAYLFHHEGLITSEVRVLKSLGHEVYLPIKISMERHFYATDEVIKERRDFRAAPEVLEALDSIDFYEDRIFTPEQLSLLENSFDLIMVSLYSVGLAIQLAGSDSLVCIRIFGRDGAATYYDYLKTGFLSVLSAPNVVFLSAYRAVTEHEPVHVRVKTHTLGLPLNQSLASYSWVGTVPKIMFTCSRLINNAYYHRIYNEFYDNFKNYSYTIFGHQDNTTPIYPAPASNFRPNLSHSDYIAAMQEYRVMYYHSTELRHLHYHPLDAMLVGMPVIYMAPSLLSSFNPGSIAECATIMDAQDKLTRILNGDKAFTAEVIAANEYILSRFSDELYIAEFQEFIAKFPMLKG